MSADEKLILTCPKCGEQFNEEETDKIVKQVKSFLDQKKHQNELISGYEVALVKLENQFMYLKEKKGKNNISEKEQLEIEKIKTKILKTKSKLQELISNKK